MPDASAWEAFAGVGAVMIFLGSLYLAFQRLGILRGGSAKAEPDRISDRTSGREQDRAAEMKNAIAQLERDLAALRLTLAEHYIRRDDWVPMTSRVLGLLEQHSVALARLEERSLAERRHRAK